LTAKAVEALLDFTQKKKKADKSKLIEEADPVMVLMSVKKIPDKQKLKPITIKLPHSLHRDEDAKVCLFVKDPQRKVKDMVEEAGITTVDTVMGISKLRDRYKQYEDKRKLSNSFDLFLADDAIYPLLPRLLGKAFVKAKRQPIPVNFNTKGGNGSKEKLAKVIQTARDSTCYYPGWGACSNVRVGRTDFEQGELVQNIDTVVSAMVEHIPKKWANVQSIHIKTHDSIALPIYNALPDAVMQIKDTKKQVKVQKNKEASIKQEPAAKSKPAAAASKAKALASKKVAPKKTKAKAS